MSLRIRIYAKTGKFHPDDNKYLLPKTHTHTLPNIRSFICEFVGQLAIRSERKYCTKPDVMVDSLGQCVYMAAATCMLCSLNFHLYQLKISSQYVWVVICVYGIIENRTAIKPNNTKTLISVRDTKWSSPVHSLFFLLFFIISLDIGCASGWWSQKWVPVPYIPTNVWLWIHERYVTVAGIYHPTQFTSTACIFYLQTK